MMKLDRKKRQPSVDTSAILEELERTMAASIAMMKRIRRERRRAMRPSGGEAMTMEQPEQ